MKEPREPANRPGTAKLCLIQDLHASVGYLNTKVRLVGRSVSSYPGDGCPFFYHRLLMYLYSFALSSRVLAADEVSSNLLLEHDNCSVLVDVSLCMATREQGSMQYIPRLKTLVSVIGHVESNLDEACHLFPFRPCLSLSNNECLGSMATRNDFRRCCPSIIGHQRSARTSTFLP